MNAIPFLIAFALGLGLVPLVRTLSLRWGKVSQPREDRWHRKPTPTLGGVAIFASFGLSLLVMLVFNGGALKVHWGVVVSAGLMFLLGLYDDFKHLSPQAKLTGQILAAALVISLGYSTDFFSPRMANPALAQLFNNLLTFIWLVGITNATNLLDNMDGLAGGIAWITAAFLCYFFWASPEPGLLWISLALAGSILAFLVYNFPPASIFMGDSGSLFLGFTLAVLSIARQPQASNVFAVLGVPTLLFLLPILDTALVTFTRLLRGQSPAQGGRDHTSHRLIAFGLNERQAVIILYLVALLSGALAAALESIQYWFSLVLVPLLVISLAVSVAYLGGLKILPASAQMSKGKAITRIMLELTFRRRLLEVGLDFFLIAIAYYLAILVRSGFNMDEIQLRLFLNSLPVALASAYIAFFVAGVYRGVWRYVDFGDLTGYLQAALGSMVLFIAGMYSLEAAGWQPLAHTMPPSIFLLFALFLFLCLAATRSSFRVFDLVQSRHTVQRETRVVILGASDNGEMALRWIQMNPKLNYQPVGLLDNDPFIQGRKIHGVPVLGTTAQLEQVLNQTDIQGVISALPDNAESEIRQARLLCQEHGCWFRRLRLEFEEF